MRVILRVGYSQLRELGTLDIFMIKERSMTNFSNASARRVAFKLIDRSEDKIQEVLSNLEPEFKNAIVAELVKKRIERGRNAQAE